MTASEFAELIGTAEFNRELTEISSYLASVTQEGPIVHLIAKHLWKSGTTFKLEERHQDLMVGSTHFEFKYNLDKMAMALRKDLARWPDLNEMWLAYESGRKGKSWSTMAKIYEDVCAKKNKHHPDVFVWIICARDLSHVTDEELQNRRVCMWKDQRKYAKEVRTYSRAVESIPEVAEFLNRLGKCPRPFKRNTVSVTTQGDLFESTYHFIICDFQNT